MQIFTLAFTSEYLHRKYLVAAIAFLKYADCRDMQIAENIYKAGYLVASIVMNFKGLHTQVDWKVI